MIDTGASEQRQNLFSTDVVQQTIDHCRDLSDGSERGYWEAMHGFLVRRVMTPKMDATCRRNFHTFAGVIAEMSREAPDLHDDLISEFAARLSSVG